MLDPLSLVASIVGLIAASAKVTAALYSFAGSASDVPGLAARIRTETEALNPIFSQLHALIQGSGQMLESDYSSVDKLVTDLRSTFSQLEKVLANVRDTPRGQVEGNVANNHRTWSRIKWAWKTPELRQLLEDLQRQKLSLTLMILAIHSHSNVETNRLMVDLRDNVNFISGQLRTIMSNEDVPRINNGDDSASFVTTATTRTSGTWRIPYESILSSTRVYRYPQFWDRTLHSARSSVRGHTRWTTLTDLVSDISVISLPILPQDIRNLNTSDDNSHGIFEVNGEATVPSCDDHQRVSQGRTNRLAYDAIVSRPPLRVRAIGYGHHCHRSLSDTIFQPDHKSPDLPPRKAIALADLSSIQNPSSLHRTQLTSSSFKAIAITTSVGYVSPTLFFRVEVDENHPVSDKLTVQRGQLVRVFNRYIVYGTCWVLCGRFSPEQNTIAFAPQLMSSGSHEQIHGCTLSRDVSFLSEMCDTLFDGAESAPVWLEEGQALVAEWKEALRQYARSEDIRAKISIVKTDPTTYEAINLHGQEEVVAVIGACALQHSHGSGEYMALRILESLKTTTNLDLYDILQSEDYNDKNGISHFMASRIRITRIMKRAVWLADAEGPIIPLYPARARNPYFPRRYKKAY
ncbi:hypothetical protein BDD12DRAFT_875843 [Trichophaea hybrida]|nr:hypothetical protein BDD12DRAFT_875843 [Trichophaea hybrida]